MPTLNVKNFNEEVRKFNESLYLILHEDFKYVVDTDIFQYSSQIKKLVENYAEIAVKFNEVKDFYITNIFPKFKYDVKDRDLFDVGVKDHAKIIKAFASISSSNDFIIKYNQTILKEFVPKSSSSKQFISTFQGLKQSITAIIDDVHHLQNLYFESFKRDALKCINDAVVNLKTVISNYFKIRTNFSQSLKIITSLCADIRSSVLNSVVQYDPSLAVLDNLPSKMPLGTLVESVKSLNDFISSSNVNNWKGFSENEKQQFLTALQFKISFFCMQVLPALAYLAHLARIDFDFKPVNKEIGAMFSFGKVAKSTEDTIVKFRKNFVDALDSIKLGFRQNPENLNVFFSLAVKKLKDIANSFEKEYVSELESAQAGSFKLKFDLAYEAFFAIEDALKHQLTIVTLVEFLNEVFTQNIKSFIKFLNEDVFVLVKDLPLIIPENYVLPTSFYVKQVESRIAFLNTASSDVVKIYAQLKSTVKKSEVENLFLALCDLISDVNNNLSFLFKLGGVSQASSTNTVLSALRIATTKLNNKKGGLKYLETAQHVRAFVKDVYDCLENYYDVALADSIDIIEFLVKQLKLKTSFKPKLIREIDYVESEYISPLQQRIENLKERIRVGDGLSFLTEKQKSYINAVIYKLPDIQKNLTDENIKFVDSTYLRNVLKFLGHAIAFFNLDYANVMKVNDHAENIILFGLKKQYDDCIAAFELIGTFVKSDYLPAFLNLRKQLDILYKESSRRIQAQLDTIKNEHNYVSNTFNSIRQAFEKGDINTCASLILLLVSPLNKSPSKFELRRNLVNSVFDRYVNFLTEMLKIFTKLMELIRK